MYSIRITRTWNCNNKTVNYKNETCGRWWKAQSESCLNVKSGVIDVEISGVAATKFVRLYDRQIQISAKPINPVKAIMEQTMVRVKTNVLVLLRTT
jgi:hypothetical protein